VCLWNRFQQMLDYANRSVSLNRRQTQYWNPTAAFRIVIAHRDPGCAQLARHRRAHALGTGVLALLPAGG
jgi:hypothetical protein